MKTILILAVPLMALLVGCGHKSDAPARRHVAREQPNKTAKQSPAVYPYSVVPGGVESKEDVREAMAGDVLTASHYADLNVATLEQVTLRSETTAYVSYRKDGAIYWTRKPVRLAAGEKVLSNGMDCIRGRCGNRVSFEPRTPVIKEAEREPVAAVFQTPQTKAGNLVMDEILPPLPMMALKFPGPTKLVPATETPGPLMIIPAAGPPEDDVWPPGPALASIPSEGTVPPSWMPYPVSSTPAIGGGFASSPTVGGVIPTTAPVTVVTSILPVQILPVGAVGTAIVPVMFANPPTIQLPTIVTTSSSLPVPPVTPPPTSTIVTPGTPGTPTPPDVPVTRTTPMPPATPNTPTTPGIPLTPPTDAPPPSCCSIYTSPPPGQPPLTPEPTPEPATLLMMACGLGLLLLKRFR